MSKETFIQTILIDIGSLLFSLGMCMCLIKEWDLFNYGVVLVVVGAIVLILLFVIYRKNHPKEIKLPCKRILITYSLGIISVLLMGYGMSKIMTGSPTKQDMIVGFVCGIIGLIGCILNYPIYAYTNQKK